MSPLPQAPRPESSVREGPNWAILGALFGLLGAISIWLWAPIGVSTTYPRFIGTCLNLVSPKSAQANPMLVQIGPFLTPESFLVLGLYLGGLLASRWKHSPVLGSFADGPVHTSETTWTTRAWHAFLGGFLILFGARMAGGCTSGHIISGIMQLSISGFVFAIGVFTTGILTAKAMARRRQA